MGNSKKDSAVGGRLALPLVTREFTIEDAGSPSQSPSVRSTGTLRGVSRQPSKSKPDGEVEPAVSPLASPVASPLSVRVDSKQQQHQPQQPAMFASFGRLPSKGVSKESAAHRAFGRLPSNKLDAPSQKQPLDRQHSPDSITEQEPPERLGSNLSSQEPQRPRVSALLAAGSHVRRPTAVSSGGKRLLPATSPATSARASPSASPAATPRASPTTSPRNRNQLFPEDLPPSPTASPQGLGESRLSDFKKRPSTMAVIEFLQNKGNDKET